MATAPLYNIGDVVYLRESAALGFLEAYIIKEMTHQPDGNLVYTLVTSLKPPEAVQTIGDRVTGQLALPIKFYEEDLIEYTEALELCISNLQTQLNTLQALQARIQGTG
jgi:hypothetical protein